MIDFLGLLATLVIGVIVLGVLLPLGCYLSKARNRL